MEKSEELNKYWEVFKISIRICHITSSDVFSQIFMKIDEFTVILRVLKMHMTEVCLPARG